MVHSVCNDSDDENLSTHSHLSNDGYNVSGSSNRAVLKKGPWTSSEDTILVDYVKQHGEGNWNAIQKHTELSRCGKSCRLRWANHLRPNLKKGAFTLEEEQLIIELHAKMGNKWARMAAQLPGRTDNEIKNYWNTRIKRRTRAGLPLYPPELSLQVQPQSLHNLNSPGIYGGDQGYGDMSQSSNYQTPDLIFDSLTGLPYRAGLPDTSRSASLINGFGPQFCTFVPQLIRPQRYDQDLDKLLSEYDGCAAYKVPPLNRNQSESYGNKVIQSFGLGLPYDPDNSNKVVTVAACQDSHFVPNGISSASLPSIGVEKYELPSFQYQDTCLGDPAPKSLDYLGNSPSYSQLPSHCPSRGSSGLLDDLLYEARALRKTGNEFSESTASTIYSQEVTNSSAMKTCLPEFKGYPFLTSQFDNSIASTSDGYNRTEHHAKSEMGDGSWIVDIERKESPGGVNYSRPDALLGSCWFMPSYSPSKEHGYEDIGSDSYMSAETSTSSWGGLSSCTWNNMPAVCQMSELP